MSASDAAPLPRLGEVFFDVRGDSRTMRLSWYADTDVAVFSIWHGGKCTGTFRLPMDDLSRMIEVLRRGPEGRSGRRSSERRSPERGPGERRPSDYGARGYDSDRTVVHGGPASAGDYGAGQYGTGDFSSPEFGPAPGYDGNRQSRGPRHRTERYESADYGVADPDSEWWPDSDNAGYGEQRFAPGFMEDSEYRLPADPASRSRHSAGRHGGGPAQ
jgi:hypothetical protein